MEKYLMTVKEYFECPRCGINFEVGEEVEVTPFGELECMNCDLEISVVVNDDGTIEL